MPNWVENKIIFESNKAEEIFDSVCPDGKFDFNLLIPVPIYVYRGNLGWSEIDFPIDWYSWNRENWGTKWNCCEQQCSTENDKGYIKFATAWSVPYPVIVAFANKFQVEFDHYYMEESESLWGIEKWGRNEFCENIHRILKRKNLPEDKEYLFSELLGDKNHE